MREYLANIVYNSPLFSENRLLMSKRELDRASKSIMRRHNLERFIRIRFGKMSNGELDKKAFLQELKKRMLAGSENTDNKKVRYEAIRDRLYKFFLGAPLSNATALTIEQFFKMSGGELSLPVRPKAPAYVFISCAGWAVKDLFEALQKEHIVDETAIIAGDSDIFIRLYETPEQIKHFLIEVLPMLIEREAIYSTKTHFSFEKSYWQRYNPPKHPDF